jgi:hypothetical protein
VSKRRIAVALSGLLIPAGACVATAHAGTITIACEADRLFNAPAMTIVFAGEAEGTLTITAPFGEIALPAAKEDREGTDGNGQPLTATGILASGPATVQMPDKAAIESCVKGKLQPDELRDSDIVFVTVMGCAKDAPPAAEPTLINASVEIALLPEVYVGLKRSYAEPTDLAVGTIALDSYPRCSRKE